MGALFYGAQYKNEHNFSEKNKKKNYVGRYFFLYLFLEIVHKKFDHYLKENILIFEYKFLDTIF